MEHDSTTLITDHSRCMGIKINTRDWRLMYYIENDESRYLGINSSTYGLSMMLVNKKYNLNSIGI